MFSNPDGIIEYLGIESSMSVADFGAGSGFYTFAAAKMEANVYAIDIQKELLSKISNEAKLRHLTNIEVIWADLEENSTLKENSMDIVISANTLFQIEDKKAFVREAFRVLKSGGRFLVVDWSESFGGMGPQTQDVVNEKKARDICEEEGFVFESSIPHNIVGAHHYGFILRK